RGSNRLLVLLDTKNVTEVSTDGFEPVSDWSTIVCECNGESHSSAFNDPIWRERNDETLTDLTAQFDRAQAMSQNIGAIISRLFLTATCHQELELGHTLGENRVDLKVQDYL